MAIESGFLNVDLDIRAPSGLWDLVVGLSRTTFALQLNEEFASLELIDQPTSPDDAIKRFAEALSSITVDLKQVWDNSTSRCFNIGFSSSTGGTPLHYAISEKSIATVRELRASIVVTIYSTSAPAPTPPATPTTPLTT